MTREDWREAAVLVLLSDPALPGATVSEPDLLLTRRALTMRSQPGQMSFPGGAKDEGETPEETALREAHEEIGLDSISVNVQARLARSDISPRRFSIVPVLATWNGAASVGIANPFEVDSIHRISVRDFANPHNRVTAMLDDQPVGPGFSLGPISVWGFTARVVDEVLRNYGWEQPWDVDRVRAVPEEFRRPHPPLSRSDAGTIAH